MEYSIGFAKKEEAFASFRGLPAPVWPKWANALEARRTETGDFDLPALARFQEKWPDYGQTTALVIAFKARF